MARSLLLIAPPIAPLGDLRLGGVGSTIDDIVYEYSHNPLFSDVSIRILCPKGSVQTHAHLIECEGDVVASAQTLGFTEPPAQITGTVLESYLHYLNHTGTKDEQIINFAYDPVLYDPTLTQSLPLFHYISMGHINTHISQSLSILAHIAPHRVAMISKAQKETFPFSTAQCQLLTKGIRLPDLPSEQPVVPPSLTWVSRISPEKGLEDAFEVAALSKLRLHIIGPIQDNTYFQTTIRKYPHCSFYYHGYLKRSDLLIRLFNSHVLLLTPKWDEALGLLALEAMACQCPVIAYNRGGYQHSIYHDQTGFLVQPDSPEAIADCLPALSRLCRSNCRRHIERHFNLSAFCRQLLDWSQIPEN